MQQQFHAPTEMGRKNRQWLTQITWYLERRLFIPGFGTITDASRCTGRIELNESLGKIIVSDCNESSDDIL
jgi:hypothetical protein